MLFLDELPEFSRRALEVLRQRLDQWKPEPFGKGREQQGPGRVLAEATGEQRRGGQLPDDEVFEFVGLGEQ